MYIGLSPGDYLTGIAPRLIDKREPIDRNSVRPAETAEQSVLPVMLP